MNDFRGVRRWECSDDVLQKALLRLWREKRGEAEPEDLSDNLIVQLGMVTEDLNRRWYERNTGRTINHVQRHLRHPVVRLHHLIPHRLLRLHVQRGGELGGGAREERIVLRRPDRRLTRQAHLGRSTTRATVS